MALLPVRKNIFSFFPTLETTFTDPHRVFLGIFEAKIGFGFAENTCKYDDYTKKVSVSEHSIMKVYIYIGFLFNAVNVVMSRRSLSERQRSLLYDNFLPLWMPCPVWGGDWS